MNNTIKRNKDNGRINTAAAFLLTVFYTLSLLGMITFNKYQYSIL
jgi:hypothetical protein